MEKVDDDWAAGVKLGETPGGLAEVINVVTIVTANPGDPINITATIRNNGEEDAIFCKIVDEDTEEVYDTQEQTIPADGTADFSHQVIMPFRDFNLRIDTGHNVSPDIAYIIKNQPDDVITSIIDEMGYNYEVVDESEIPTRDFSIYKMILFSEENLDNYELIPVSQINTLMINPRTAYLEDWGIADYSNVYSTSQYADGTIVGSHPITNGLTSPIRFHTAITKHLNVLPGNVALIAPGMNILMISSTNRCIIGTILPGGGLFRGGTAQSRIAYFGIDDTDSWTEDSKILLENSINWVIGVI